MKKIYLIAMTAIMLVGCDAKKSGNADNGADATRDSLRVALAEQDSLLVLMTDIQQGLNDIKSLENIMNSDQFSQETPNKREEIRSDMQLIQQTLIERSKRLAELEARLKKSNNNNAHLQAAIETLRQQIAQQEETIATLRTDLAAANIYIEELTSDVASLNQTVEDKNEEIAKAQATTENLANELNVCYYAVGSKKELKDNNIISSGFLRKTKIMPEDFDQNFFTRADKRTLSSIPLHSKKAKVLTNQPSSSYTIKTDANGMKVLEITFPAEFWATTNYVVIQID